MNPMDFTLGRHLKKKTHVQVGKEIRDKIMDTPFQEDFEEELKATWQK